MCYSQVIVYYFVLVGPIIGGIIGGVILLVSLLITLCATVIGVRYYQRRKEHKLQHTRLSHAVHDRE